MLTGVVAFRGTRPEQKPEMEGWTGQDSRIFEGEKLTQGGMFIFTVLPLADLFRVNLPVASLYPRVAHVDTFLELGKVVSNGSGGMLNQ